MIVHLLLAVINLINFFQTFFLDDSLKRSPYFVTDVVKSDISSDFCDVFVSQKGQNHSTTFRVPCGGEVLPGSQPLDQKVRRYEITTVIVLFTTIRSINLIDSTLVTQL